MPTAAKPTPPTDQAKSQAPSSATAVAEQRREIAIALGVPETALERWTQDAPRAEAKAASKSKSRTLYFDRPLVNSTMAAWYPREMVIGPREVREFLDDCNGDAALVKVNSPGGNAFSGTEILSMFDEYISEYGADKLAFKVTGLAASAASIILMAEGAKVSMSVGSQIMIHNPWSVAIGDYREMERMRKALQSLATSMVEAYKRRMESGEAAQKAMDDESWYNREEAISAGLCDAESADSDEKAEGDNAADHEESDENGDSVEQAESSQPTESQFRSRARAFGAMSGARKARRMRRQSAAAAARRN